MPCVYITPSASSTLLNGFHLDQEVPRHTRQSPYRSTPTQMAPQPLTQPAHGVIPTKPADHFVNATQEGRSLRFGEQIVHTPSTTRTPTAVAIFVLTTAADISMPA